MVNLGLSNKLVKIIGELPAKNLLYLYGDSTYING